MHMALHNDELAFVEIAVRLTHIRFSRTVRRMYCPPIEVSQEGRVEIES